MDRNLKIHIILYFTLIMSVSTLTESRLVYSLGPSSSINPSRPSRTHGDIQAQHADVNRQQSAQPRPVVVRCYPDSMEVVVQADMFDTGLHVEGRNLHLGSDTAGRRTSCGAESSGEAQFTIRTKLMDCGTKLSSNKEKIIYSNVLVYSPEPSHDGLLRLDGVSVPVECHYEKRYAVDGISLLPTWVPSVSTASAEDQIDFSLLLMTDDWLFERGSYSYFLGDPICIQVSAIIRKHIPLRVYVDHCVATPTPDAHKTLRHDFIEHHGCLTDANLTNSNSYFLPRLEDPKLRFQLDAFKFYQENSNQIYITCHVKAVPVGLAVSSQTRACSFTENSWRSIDGNDQACQSCDITNRAENPPPTEPPTAKASTKARPSITPQRSLVHKLQEHSPSTFVRVRPGMPLRGHIKPQYSSAGIMKRGAEQTIQTGPITILRTSKTDKTNRFQNILTRSRNS